MSEALSKLMVVLGADTAAYQADIGKAAESTKTHFSAMADYAKMAAGAMAGLFAFEKLKEGIEHAADYADELAHMARNSSQSVEQLSKMSYALRLSDTSMEDYQEGIKKLSKNMVSAANGNETMSDTFERLGVKVKDANGNVRDSSDVFLDVADKISQMQDGAEKTTLEMQLFGKSSGPKLQELLNSGKKGITDLTDEAKKMGLEVSGKTASAAADLKDQMERLHAVSEGLYMQIASDVLPVMNDFASRAMDAATNSGVLSGAGTVISVVFKGVYSAIVLASTQVEYYMDTVAKYAAAAASLATGHLAEAKSILNDDSAEKKQEASILQLEDMWIGVSSAADMAAAAQKKAKGSATSDDDDDDSDDKKNRKGKDAMKHYMDAVEQIRQQNATEEVREQAKYEKDRQLLLHANASAFKSASERNAMLETLESEHLKRMDEIKKQAADKAAQHAEEQNKKALNDILDSPLVTEIEYEAMVRKQAYEADQQAHLEAEKAKQIAAVDTKNFIMNGLHQLSSSHSAAAKAAQAVSKAQALSQIASQTPVMAAQAASAVAGIPVIGPALAQAASTSMYALGALMAADVMSGGKSGAGGGGGVSVGNASAVTPVSQQQPQQPTTILNIPENALLTGRMLVDLLNDALGDGKQLSNLRVMGV